MTKLPVRIDPKDPLTLVKETDPNGIHDYEGRLPLLKTKSGPTGTLHIRNDDSRDVRRVCDNTYSDAEAILGLVYPKKETGKYAEICGKCRKKIESGEARYYGQKD